MALPDRIEPLCDLLMGAAYADDRLEDRERDEVRGLLEDLGGPLSAALDRRIAGFNPKKFELAKVAAVFRDDSEDDRKRVVFLVAAIHEADDEIDFAEDDYLRALAKALALPDSALAGMTVDIESDELQDSFAKVRRGPPAPPPAKTK